MRLRWRDVVDNIIERDNRDVTIEDVTDFVISKARSATHPVFGKVTNDSRPRPFFDKAKRQSSAREAGFATQAQQTQKPQEGRPKCSICGSSHWISRCDKFRKHTLEERQKLVKEKTLCINCLCTGHFVRACTKESFCKVEGCNNKHSSFLHPRSQAPHASNENRESEVTRSEQPITDHSSSSVSNGYVTSKKPQQSTRSTSVMGLAIVPVKVKARDSSKIIETYAFLDAGSNTTFCTEGLLQELNMEGKKTKLSLTTIQNENVPTHCSVVNLEIFDLNKRNLVELPKVYSTPSLPISTSCIGKQDDVERWPHLKGINIQNINADIGLLIGSDVPRESKNG